jgi:hypothetical protein
MSATFDIINGVLQSAPIADSTDPTKQISFNTSAATTSTQLTLGSLQTTSQIINFPNVSATDVAMTLGTSQTITGIKTFSSAPVISTITNGGGTLTLPTSTDTLIGRDTTDALTNKTLNNTSVFHVDSGDATKRIGFQSSGSTTATTLTLVAATTANRSITFPDTTDTVVTLGATQTLTNKTLTLPTIASINNGGTITIPSGAGTLVTLAATQTITNKTLTAPVIATIVNTGTLTLPTSSDTLVGRATTDTLTNKTLTSPVISTIVNTGTLTLPTSTDTLVGRATTDTLTNKTLNNTNVFHVDSGDATKRIGFQSSGSTTATTLTLVAATTANRSITFPDTTDTVVTLAATQTLTNKTLTTPSISSGLSSAFWGVSGLQFRTLAGTLTDTSSTGTVGTVLASNSFGIPILAASSATTYTNATNMYIAGAPTAGTNVTITNPYSLYVASGNSYMAGNLTLANTTSSRVTTPVAELVLEQTGDTFGTTRLRLQNRNGANGAIFEQAGTANVIDFIFSTPAGSNQNIRFDQRPGNVFSPLNSSGEFGFGVAGNPSFIAGPGACGVLGTRLFTIGASGANNVTPRAQLHVLGNISSTAWGANGIRSRFDAATYTDTNSTGTVALVTGSSFAQPTFAASSATTYTESSTLYISGEPIAGTNVTQTAAYALHVAAGNVKFGGNSIVCGSNTTITNGSGVLTLPTSTDTLVGRATTDTLSNKTLTAPVIATIVNTGTLTLPTSTDTLVGRATTDTLTNKNLSNTNVFHVDGADATKRIAFQSSGSTTATTATLVVATTANRSITIPDVTDTLVARTTTDTLTNKTLTAPIIATINNGGTVTIPTGPETLVGRATTDTLTNKTLTAPVIATITNVGTLTLPTSTDTLVGRATTDTLTNKNLSNTNVFHVDGADATKRIAFQSSGSTTATTATLVVATTANRSITIPDATDTLVGRTTTDTLTNKTLTAPVIATITNTGTLTLPTSTDTLVGRNTTDTLTNKNLSNTNVFHVDGADATKRIAFQSSGSTTATTATLVVATTANRSITIPDATDTLVGRATTDTLTNKTLTAPIISSINNGGTVTIPTGPETLVGRATTDTLTNKNITGTTNTIDANNLRNGSTWVTSLSGAAPVQHQLLSYNGTNAVWQSPLFAYLATQLLTYNVGTVAQSGTVLTGSGTTFTPAMVGGLLFYSGNANPVQIVGFINATSLIVDISQTVGSATTYILYYGAFASNGNGYTSTKYLNAVASGCGNTYYATGTASQTTTTITGVGTTFTASMVGGIIRWTSGEVALIVGFTSATVLTTLLSQTVASGTYVIIYGGSGTDCAGAVAGNALRLIGTTNQMALGLDGSDTTLNFPATAGGQTLTFPTTTDTIVGRATTDTLTNKTITGTTNTIRATQLATTTGDVVVSGAAAPATGQFLIATSATTAAWAEFSSLSVGWQVTFQEQLASGTNGGATVANTYVTRGLNTTLGGGVAWASLAANTVTLSVAGTYIMYAWTTTRANSASRSRIQNTTANTTVILGRSVASTIATVNLVHLMGPVEVTIAGSTNFQIQTRAATAVATTGLGAPAGTGESEVYTTFYIRRIA